MIDYGVPPEAEETEVMLFGPGYGEALAVHLGDGVWLLVDSCIDPEADAPASAAYLAAIGVRPDQVRVIVASHWHDDHVRGISQLTAAYPEADFLISAVFDDREAAAFLAAYSGSSSSGLSRGTKELYEIVTARNAVIPALHRSIVFEDALNGRQVRVTALSPVPAAFSRAIAHMAGYVPTKGDPINHVPELRPNIEAVVLRIDFGDDAVLLGADLEEHAAFGWSAIVADSWSGSRRAATAYKVSHHGSCTGDCGEIWASLLQPEPIACMTPFMKGRQRLPSNADKARMKQNTPHAYISSAASRRPKMDHDQLKRLGDICKDIALADSSFGAVRIRRRIDDTTPWNVELFGAAQRL